MYQTHEKPVYRASNDELVDVLTQISIVSMRLARKITLLAEHYQITEGGGKADEPNEQYGRNYRRTTYCGYRD